MADEAHVRLATVSALASHLAGLDDLPERPFTEALLTTFNVDLGFFETRALGLLRATGAAVTVLADSSVYAPDPRAIKGAGHSYHLGLAHMHGAFHPKVTVLAGPDRAFVAVGSGNVTTGGWLSNDETLTVAFGDREGGVPRIIGEIAAWLRSLDSLTMGAIARQAVIRAADALEHLTQSAPAIGTGHRLVTTSAGPIIDQLPEGATEELRLYAPFHDPAGAALAALLDRYQPNLVRIAVQPRRTIIEPDRLQAVARERGAELVWQDAGGPYRHGKVIEATGSHSAWTLTGSPNITAAALLKSMVSGGNCEVGVVAESSKPVYPGTGEALPAHDVPPLSIQSTPGEGTSQHQGATLLAATLADEAIHIELAGPAPAGIVVQASQFHDLPEHFTDLGPIPEGQREESFPDHGAPASSRIRLRWTQDGAAAWGPVVPLTDPAAVVRRVSRSRSSHTNVEADWQSLFGSEALRAEWNRQLERIAREQLTAALPRAPVEARAQSSALSPAEGWRSYDDEQAWARYSDDAVARLGPSLAHLASGGLILPHLGSTHGAPVSTSEPLWVDDFTQDATKVDDEETAERQDEQTGPDEGTPPQPKAPPNAYQRARLRGWLARLAAGTASLPAIDRSVFVRLALIGSYIDTWDGADAPWFGTLATAAEALPGDDIPVQLEPELAALAALCLYRLDQGAPPDHRTGDGRRYVELSQALVPLAAKADLARVRVMAEAIPVDPVLGVDPESVIELVVLANDPNPWPQVVHLIGRKNPDWYVELERDGVIYIEGRFTNAQRVAADAITFAPNDATVAVRLRPKRGTETIVIRHEGTLTVQGEVHGRASWRTYRLTNLITPTAITGDPETERRARIDRPPWNTVSATAKAALEAAGFGAESR